VGREYTAPSVASIHRSLARSDQGAELRALKLLGRFDDLADCRSVTPGFVLQSWEGGNETHRESAEPLVAIWLEQLVGWWGRKRFTHLMMEQFDSPRSLMRSMSGSGQTGASRRAREERSTFS
jgi:hypothetical protein